MSNVSGVENLFVDNGGELFVGDSALWVSVAGPVKSKSNYRNSGSGAWADQAAYTRVLQAMFRAHRPAGWVRPDPGVSVKDRLIVVGVMVARTGLDAGNLSKSVLDAGEGVLWVSDAEVRTVCESVERTRSNPGLGAAFAQVSGNPNSVERVALCTQMHELLLERVPIEG